MTKESQISFLKGQLERAITDLLDVEANIRAVSIALLASKRGDLEVVKKKLDDAKSLSERKISAYKGLIKEIESGEYVL